MTAADRETNHRTHEGVRLLKVAPELAEDLSPGELAEAERYAILPAVRLDDGPWSPARLDEAAAASGARGRVRGFLIIDGCVTMSVRLAERECVRLLTAGELVLLDGLAEDSLPVSWGWSALGGAGLAILDERLMVIGRHWPGLLAALLRRAAQQTRQTLLQQAISQLPRVEDRLLALFWVVADHNGVVRGDGILVQLSITHELLAQMVGARRPTVSLGLRHLEDTGLLRAVPGGWLINRESLDRFPDPDGVPSA